MDQWLDSLSEDWVSQPRSSHSNSINRSFVERDASSLASNGSRSRIPRYKARLSSSSSTAGEKELGNTFFENRRALDEPALREKTSSNVNASHKSLPSKQAKASSPKLNQTPRQHRISTASVSLVPQDTVHHKPSPSKSGNSRGTPDWKRRVLKENIAKGQPDLFSPIGLEGVFKPPTISAKPKAKSTGKRKPPTVEDLPSSPSPCHPPFTQQLRGQGGELNKPITSILEEPAEQISLEKLPQLEVKTERASKTSKTTSGRSIDIQPTGPFANSDKGDCKPSVGDLPILPIKANKPITRAVSEGAERSRIFSGHENNRNENISPFYVSRRNTVDGHVEYAAVDMSMRRLRFQMDMLRQQQQNLPSSRSNNSRMEYEDLRPSDSSLLRSMTQEVTSQSLPDDLSMGTDAYAANGGFISIRRGGYSNEGSFQHRALSPSSLPDLDGPSLRHVSSTNEALQTQEFPENTMPESIGKPSTPPRTPKRQGPKDSSSFERPRSSGSPLKLFDKYDTFTNDRLARRMSKFEETLHRELQEGEAVDGIEDTSPPPEFRSTDQQPSPNSEKNVTQNPRVSSFGAGLLDDHQFPHSQKSTPNLPLDQVQQYSGASERLLPDLKKFRFERSPSYRPKGEKPDVSSRSHRGDRNVEYHRKDDTDDGELQKKTFNDDRDPIDQGQQEVLQTAHGKRLPYSPAKDPAPKRRRTLHSSEEAQDEYRDHQQHLEIKEAPVKSILGKKRKDALYDNDRQSADPSTIAMRRILHPRTPTLQSSFSTRKVCPIKSTHVQSSVDVEIETSPHTSKRDDDALPSIDPPTQIVAGALATVALNTAQEITTGSRKASVTTADFFNEAQQIMQLIRTRGRPHSSHTTAEGSDAGPPTIVEESFVEASTKDEFSRPPSREGGSLPRLREPVKMDSRVISHLRQFEDKEDLGLVLSSSLKSLHIGQSIAKSHSAAPDNRNERSYTSRTESDPPNVRIRESRIHSHEQNHSSPSHEVSVQETDLKSRSQDSQPTTGHSTGHSTDHSNPTGSSRSSANKMVIAPETVAHLLTDQMAGMFFDRERQLWVKRKGSANKETHDHTASEDTDEDLFGDIPDLSVDEMEELQRVKEAVSSVKSFGSAAPYISCHDQAVIAEIKKELPFTDTTVETARPKTAEGRSIPVVENSSVPSKFSNLASSVPIPGTRATSWGDDALPPTSPEKQIVTDADVPADLKEERVEEVEHEISILEGRELRTPRDKKLKQRQARVVTVAFSSPLIDHKERSYTLNNNDDFEGESLSNLEESPACHYLHPIDSGRRRTSVGALQKSGHRGFSSHVSVGNQSYLARPMSRLDEQDEMSVEQCPVGDRHMSLDVAISTPLPASRSLLVPPPTTGKRSGIGFHLSPLPDFSVHQIDKVVDGDRGKFTKRLGGFALDDNNNKLSLAGQSLVKNLTDLEPYEPYWDYIRSVDLHDRQLKTLHMLDDFCGRVEELDVSNNQIGELGGIPRNVRLLKIQGNRLTDLAAWNHLPNLQYLDLSNNQLQSLGGLRGLVHLRALRIDNNGITCLNGLEDLDGLISLRLRGNRLKSIDFESYGL